MTWWRGWNIIAKLSRFANIDFLYIGEFDKSGHKPLVPLIPAKAGIQNCEERSQAALDPSFRWDERGEDGLD